MTINAQCSALIARASLLFALVTIAVAPLPAFGQQEGTRPLDLLQQEDVRSELNITSAQDQQLEQLRESMNDRSGFTELMKKSTQVTSEEERNQLREQMRNYASTRRAQAEQKLSEVLSGEQMVRLEQLSLQRRGARALGDDDIAQKLGLSDEQQQQLEALSQQRDAARNASTFDSNSDPDQFRAEWDAKYAAVLTPEQRQQWGQMTGTPATGAGAPAPAATAPPAVPDQAAPEGADVVASFGTPRREATSSPREPGKLYFNFRYAPWSEVLPLFAEAAGLTLDLNTIPPGTFNHIDNKGYTITEALDVLNGYLLPRGYILVRREGGFLVCVRIDEEGGIPPNLVPTVSVAELPDRGRHELLTVVFPVTTDEDVDAVAAEVEKLVGRQGKVVGVKPTRSIVVTDIGSNLMRINELLRNVTGGPEDLVFKEYELHHILADDAEYLVRTLLGLSIDGSTTASSSTPQLTDEQRRQQERAARFSRFGGGGNPFGGRQPAAAPTSSGSTNRSNSKANTIADPRTNKLLVSATPSEHRIIEEALRTVDVSERSPLASDRPFGSLGDKQMTVIPLANMDPTSATLMLQSMFLKEGDEAPTISADLSGRQLIVRGSEAQLYQIKQLLLELGEDGSGQRAAANRGPVRTINLSGRDPNELLPILERMWSAQRGSSLRVIIPGEDDATRRRTEILRDANERRQRRPVPEPRDLNEAPADDDSRTDAGRSFRDDPFAVWTDAPEVDRVPTSEVQGPSAVQLGDITVRVVGNELIIISQDEEALDDLELMLENVMQAVPPRTTWSIFPLKSADATEAAAMLEQLFPDSRVSQTSSSSGGTLGALTSGISSFGSGVADLTGLSDLGSGPQTLRIIPETRLNALWVAGPAFKVQEVEDMLKIIDSSGLTESLRDRVPRLIPVEHADIDDVFQIVSSVYAPEMQAIGGNQGGDPRQAFAQMFGGRRGGGDDENGRNAQPNEPQVTLGVDRDTSHLIVSADDATFAEIEELVMSVDQASKDARRSVMVRPLVNTNASLMQDSLQSIIPKVTVSTSASNGRPSTSTSSSGDSNGGRGGSSSSDQDAFQQRMEFFRRMREQGGGPGGFGGGGRPGGFGGGGDRGGRGFGGFGGGGGGGDRGGRGR